MKNKFLIVITGPTASGETSVGLEMAKRFNSEIISADSRQIYKEMKIGTAVPDEEQLQTVKHHFIRCISISERYNASRYESAVVSLLTELYKVHDLVFLVGGSGLYIDAVCYGIDDFPETDITLRKELELMYKNEGIEGLRDKLKLLDPLSYSRVDLKNPKRIQKALEITIMTGKPYSFFLSGVKKARPFNIIYIALNLERDELYRKINERVLQMMENGLEEEARKLYPMKDINALKTVGYKEMFECFEGLKSRDEAIAEIQANTRKYARKQLTWFRKNKNYTWFSPSQIDEIENFIKTKIC